MLMGEYQNSIDVKGRVIVPSKFRSDLGDRFVMTKGLENCLFLYPMDEWKVFEDKLKALPMTNKEARAFVRYFFSSAVECEIDKQGRLNIPQPLREHACIEKDLVTIGVMSRVEIWNRENWSSYLDASLDSDHIAEQMAELGI